MVGVCRISSFHRGIFHFVTSSPVHQTHLVIASSRVSLSPTSKPQLRISHLELVTSSSPLPPFFPHSALPVFLSVHCPAYPTPFALLLCPPYLSTLPVSSSSSSPPPILICFVPMLFFCRLNLKEIIAGWLYM